MFVARVPECSPPFGVRWGEGWVNRMKCVMVEWIVDFDFAPVISGDGNLLQLDHLVRRDGVKCPVPERLAKIKSSSLPVLFVDCVASSNYLGMLL